jgi:hypothetical protein
MNRILIISPDYQPDIDDVIDWLIYFKAEFVRITPTTIFKVKNVNICNNFKTSIDVIIQNKEYNLSEFNSIWIYNNILPLSSHFNTNNDLDNLDKRINRFFIDEWRVLTNFIFKYFEGRNTIGSLTYGSPNKLLQLSVAKECGLYIPDTQISNNFEFLKWEPKILITKPISEVFSYFEKNSQFVSRTIKLDNILINKNHNDRFPFLSQVNIPKRFELRIFYLKGKFYSSAIFSQNETNTSDDWRNSPNSLRILPFNLPKEIESKLNSFMQKLNLDIGSIDMIYSINKEFIFLEVNPVGIFQNISALCNYNIHKIIAQKLINEN